MMEGKIIMYDWLIAIMDKFIKKKAYHNAFFLYNHLTG